MDGPRVHRLTAREGEQPVGEGGGAVHRLARTFDETGRLIHTALRDAALRHFHTAADGLQHIVEIMRDAAGELADRLHFLRLPQGGFDRFPRRDLRPQLCIGFRQLTAPRGDQRFQRFRRLQDPRQHKNQGNEGGE